MSMLGRSATGRMSWPTVFDVPRHCSRPTCSEPAVATFEYDYGEAQVRIGRLSPQREPHAYDLCDRHAARLSAPQGWQVIDLCRPEVGWRIAV